MVVFHTPGSTEKSTTSSRPVISVLSSLSLAGGYIDGKVPYTNLYAGRANFRDDHVYIQRLTLADFTSFETMRMNEFLSNRYVSLSFRQNFKSLLFKTPKFAPHIVWTFRALFGALNNAHQHQSIDFKSPEEGFYESGLEFNKLLTLNANALGIGAYYRLGPYSFSDWYDNLSLKLTLRVAL